MNRGDKRNSEALAKEGIRPITTGDIGITAVMGRHKFHNISQAVADREIVTDSGVIISGSSSSNVSRPHALPSFYARRRRGTDNITEANTNSSSRPKEKRRSSTIKRNKSTSITTLWDSLNRFSRSNLGRSMNFDDSHNCNATNESSDPVHYINIEDDTGILTDNFVLRKMPIEGVTTGSTIMIKRNDFDIPELPSGKSLVINILSTWGDPHYVGLMGLEIFDDSGHPVEILEPDRQLWADPPDINILPEYNDDPRTIDNLIDGVNFTCDDLHAWLAPFTSGEDHLIGVDFERLTTLSMIRLWNYNKSRIHSHRGARYVEIMLDGKCVFKGEIRQAPGAADGKDCEACSECILFTTEMRVLQLIERYDPIQNQQRTMSADDMMSGNCYSGGLQKKQRRRELLDSYRLESQQQQQQQSVDSSSALSMSTVRPSTSAWNSRSSNSVNPAASNAFEASNSRSKQQPQLRSRSRTPASSTRPSTAAMVRAQRPISCRSLDICLQSNWGDPYLIGLSRLVAVDDSMNELSLGPPQLYSGALDSNKSSSSTVGMNIVNLGPYDCTPAEFASLQALNTAQEANDGNTDSNSTSLFHVSRPGRGQHGFPCLHFDLTNYNDQGVLLRAIKIWNYNKSEDTCCGVKHVLLFTDGKFAGEFIARKAPGYTSFFDFSQLLPLSFNSSSSLLNSSSSSLVVGNSQSKGVYQSRTKLSSSIDEEDELNEQDDDEDEQEKESDMLMESLSMSAIMIETVCNVPQQYVTPVSERAQSLFINFSIFLP